MDDAALENHLMEMGKRLVKEVVDYGAEQNRVDDCLSDVFPRYLRQTLTEAACMDWLKRHPEIFPDVKEVIMEHMIERLVTPNWDNLYAYGDKLVDERDAELPEDDDINEHPVYSPPMTR